MKKAHPSPQSVSDEAYESFLRESAGCNLDLSALPSVQSRQRKNSQSGDDFNDERFAPAPQKEKSPALYRKDLVRFVNKNAADPEVLRALRAGGVEDNSRDGQAGTVHVMVRATGEEVPVDVRFKDGFWIASAGGKNYSAESRDVLLGALARGLNQDARELTSAELREVSIICQSLGFYRGVAKYISLRTGNPEYEVMSDESILNPHNASLYDEAVHACWLACHTDFSIDDSWLEFLAAYRGSRHLSAALLDGARCAFEVRKETMERESILTQVESAPVQAEEPAPSYKELDGLSDEELSRQLGLVKKEYSKLVRAGVL